jgi:hypothetical protein
MQTDGMPVVIKKRLNTKKSAPVVFGTGIRAVFRVILPDYFRRGTPPDTGKKISVAAPYYLIKL